MNWNYFGAWFILLGAIISITGGEWWIIGIGLINSLGFIMFIKKAFKRRKK